MEHNQQQSLSQKLNPSLAEKLKAAGSTPTQPLNVIVNFDPQSAWEEVLRLANQAGLDISTQEEAIHAVFGRGTPEVVRRVAALGPVQLIELDEQANILHG